MMQPYWDAQNAGGTLLQINTNSGPGEVDNVTSALAKALNLDFELLTGLSGTECPAVCRPQPTAALVSPLILDSCRPGGDG
jgi:hypothetical protein